VESKGPVFELKINITDSEVIVVADPSQSDSSTVILKSTTVIAYRPDMPERPFSCNLNNAEVFSCVLGSEDESALSIIDPVRKIFFGDNNCKYNGDLKTGHPNSG
jgi:vacuolar protein sorting-associated protein 13D